MKALIAASVLMQGYSHQVLNTIFSGVAQSSPHFHFAQLFFFFFFSFVELDELSKIQNAGAFGIKEALDA